MIKKFLNIFLNFFRLVINLTINLLKLIFWKKTKSYYLLLLIFLLALFLRLLGTYPGYPLTHPDESTIANAAFKIVLFHDFDPANYAYGSLLQIIYAIVDFLFFVPLFYIWQFLVHFQEVLMGYFTVREAYAMLLHNYFTYFTRYETAVLSSFIVIIVYLIGKKLFNQKVGLITAFLAAVNYRHVSSSRFALPDAPAAVFGGLAMLFIIYLIRKPSLKNYLLAGFAVALSLSVKYFIYILPTFLLSHIYIVLKQKHLNFTSKLVNIVLNKKFIFSCITIVIVFFAVNSYFIYNFKGAKTELFSISDKYDLNNPSGDFLSFINGKKAFLTLQPINYLLFYSLGLVLIIFVITGFFYSAVKYFRKTIFLSTLVLSFLFIFLIVSKYAVFVRNYASITPFLLFFPAILIVDISKLVRNKKASFILLVLFSFVVGYTSLKDSFLSSLYFSQKQNIDAVKQWIDEKFDNKARINIAVTEDLPFIPKGNIAETFLIRSRGVVDNMSIDELRTKDVKWAFIGSGVTTLKNAELWSGNKYIIYASFDKEKMSNFLKNSYTGLSLMELGSYRVAEFVKPFPQSNEPAYFIVKVPNFFEKDRELVKEYNFDSEKSLNDLMVSYFSPCNFYGLKFIALGNNFSAIKIIGNTKTADKGCSLETQFMTSKSIEVKENGYYQIEGLLKRIGNITFKYQGITNGFIRLDFLSKENKIIKTAVSDQLKNIGDWQTVLASGVAPFGSKYARISFQLDQYFPEEEYLIKAFKFYKYNNYNKIDLSDYPYYNKPLPQNFYWLLEF